MSAAQTLESSDKLPTVFRSRFFKPCLIVSLIVYFLYLVLSNTPASIAAWAVHKVAPNLWLTSVQGTLWRGHAGGAQMDMGDKTIPVGQVRWVLNPWSLLMLKPCLGFETEVPGQMISGHFCQSPFGLTTIRDLNIEAPLAVISDLLPMEAAGHISIQVIHAELNGSQVNTLDARFSWQNASLYNGETWLPLGSFGGQAQAGENGDVQAKVFDISGPFSVDLSCAWFPGAENWIASGTVQPKPEAPDLVVQALRLIGEEVETGIYQLTWP